MSSDISPSLVNWVTSMMTMRLQVILEHVPVSQEQIQSYIIHTQVMTHLHCTINRLQFEIAPFQLLCVQTAQVAR